MIRYQRFTFSNTFTQLIIVPNPHSTRSHTLRHDTQNLSTKMSNTSASTHSGVSDNKRETDIRTSSSTPTTTQVSPGDRTANKPEEHHLADRHTDHSFVQSPNSRRESQDYFAKYPATPQYDHLFLDSEPISPYFRASPKSPAATSTLRTPGAPSRFHFPKSSSLPAPKFGMSPSYDHQDVEDDTKVAAATLATTGNDEETKRSSPPRERNKVSVVSPPEGENMRKTNQNSGKYFTNSI